MSEETFRWAITTGVALAALCFLMMAILSVLLYRLVTRVQVRVDDMATRVWNRLSIPSANWPSENAPKLSLMTTNLLEISANAKEISSIAKDQAHRFAEVGRDIADRAKAQIARVDAVVDDTVEQVHHAGDNVKVAVMKPVREGERGAGGRQGRGYHSDGMAAGPLLTTSRRTKKCSSDGEACAGLWRSSASER